MQNLDPKAVARAYYALPFHDRSFKSLTDQFSQPGQPVSANRLSSVVRDLEESGRIRHEVLDPDIEFLPRCPQMEDELRHRFGVRQAVVVDTASVVLPRDTQAEAPLDWAKYDDTLHTRLGAWGGRLIASNLRPGDVIATGGGRGPFYAVTKTRMSINQRYFGDIQPLTGQICARVWSHDGANVDVPPFLDADNVAATIHGRIGSRGRLRSINRPITALKQTPRTNDVDVAIFGIGALGGGHRLCEHRHLADVRSVNSLLCDINELARKIENNQTHAGPPFFHPVGDVCNCYFMVEPENGEDQRPEWRELAAKLQQLNKAFKSATPEALGKIARSGFVLAVAGGPHKAYAIRHVLRKNREKTLLTHLVTDQETARWILNKEKEPAHVAPVAFPAPAPAQKKPAATHAKKPAKA